MEMTAQVAKNLLPNNAFEGNQLLGKCDQCGSNAKRLEKMGRKNFLSALVGHNAYKGEKMTCKDKTSVQKEVIAEKYLKRLEPKQKETFVKGCIQSYRNFMSEKKALRGREKGVLTKNEAETNRSNQYPSPLYLKVYSGNRTRRTSLIERHDHEMNNMTEQFIEMVEVDINIDGQMVLRPESSSDGSNSELEMDQSSGSNDEYNPEDSLERLVSLFGDIIAGLNVIEQSLAQTSSQMDVATSYPMNVVSPISVVEPLLMIEEAMDKGHAVSVGGYLVQWKNVCSSVDDMGLKLEDAESLNHMFLQGVGLSLDRVRIWYELGKVFILIKEEEAFGR
ncbi:hypothetical protein PanWU01x14_224000 [Parasponia andersonii]|uniref:Uncharacterized protein n=1 Tax=Parasponia andersonii TaxID=3476 RepID=A0A2P5BNJ9_PARAD|nr:hypothetical protein PanWU01x14_224000 [Parasponia andersonii]